MTLSAQPEWTPCLSTIDRGWASVPAWRIYASWLAFAGCVVLALLALEQLARYQLNSQLDRTAGAVLGAIIHGDTPHRWTGRDASNLVAGKAFGTMDYVFDSRGLRMRSDGDAIEAGLVLSNAIDLRRFAELEIELASEKAGTLALVIRKSLESPSCSSEQIAFPPGKSSLSLVLHKLQWTCEGAPSSVPDRAAMLRLRLHLDSGSTLTLIDVEARTSRTLNPDSLDQLPLPLLPSLQETHAFERALDRASADSVDTLWPLFQLSTNARVEQTLLARDLIEQEIAGATVMVNGHFPEVTRLAREWKPGPDETKSGSWSNWLLGLYSLVLLWIRLRPVVRPRLRALFELIGVTAVPIALVVAGAIGDNISGTILAAGAITLTFALSLLVGSAPAQPAARTLKRGWWFALFSIALAVGVVLITTGSRLPESLPPFTQIVHYLIWAAVLQFVICVIVAERIEHLIGSALWAALGAALIFALLATPNAMLMQLAFVGGLIWVWNWQRHRALLANILAQAICALVLVSSLPADWLRSGEVSARFFLH